MLADWPRGHLISLVCLLILTGLTLMTEWLSVHRHNEAYTTCAVRGRSGCWVLLTVLLAPGKNMDSSTSHSDNVVPWTAVQLLCVTLVAWAGSVLYT